MSQCQTSPTATQFATVTTSSESTSTSTTLTTESAVVTTISTTVCSTVTSGSSISTDCSSSTITSTLTPETTITNQVPVVVTVPATLTTPTATLFTTDCSSITSGGSSSPTSPTSGSSQSSQSSQSTISSLPPTTSLSVFTTSSTLPGGSVVVVTTTSTAVFTPSTTVPISPGATTGGSNTKSSTNLGAIIGGAVGGVVGAIVLLGLVWYLVHRRHRYDDDFDDDYTPYPVTQRKGREKHDALGSADDVPRPWQDPYSYSAVNSTPEGPSGSLRVGNAVPTAGLAGVGAAAAAANLRKRNPTAPEGYMPPIPQGNSSSGGGYGRGAYSNESYPYSNAYSGGVGAATTSNGHGNIPPAPTSEGSAYSQSGTGITADVFGPGAPAIPMVPMPTTYPPRPLQVANPTPVAGASASANAGPSSLSLRDVKDPMIYLSADRGLEVRGQPLQPQPPSTRSSVSGAGAGAHSGSSMTPTGEGGSTPHLGSSSAPFVHQDAGRVPVAGMPQPQVQPQSQTPPQVQQQQPQPQPQEEPRRERVDSQTEPELPPPAYSE